MLLLCIVLFATPVHAADIVTGLVGYWKFDETSGITARDASGHGNTGALSTPAPTWGSGKFNGGLSFASNYVRVTSLENTNFPQAQGVVALWVNGSFSTQAFKPIFDTWGSRNHVFMRTNNADGKIQIYLQKTSSAYIGGGNFNLVDNTWTHIVLAYNTETDQCWIYINGVSVYQAAITDSSWTPSAQRVYIGNGFVGLIDDVRIYNRALTAADVLALYNNGGPTTLRNCVIRNAVIR